MDRKKIVITYKKVLFILITLLMGLLYISISHAEENRSMIWNNSPLEKELTDMMKQYDQPAMAAALISSKDLPSSALI